MPCQGIEDHGLQFADITGVMICGEVGNKLGTVRGFSLVQSQGGFLQKCFQKKWNILQPFPERRNLDPVGAESVEKVSAKTPFCHEAIQVLIGSDDNTGAALHSPVRTDRKVLAFLEETEQLHLGSMAQIANFIKKQGAAGSPCDHPFPCIASPGVSAFAVAEKGVGKHHIVEPGRINPYKITASAAESMDGPGHQLLADTGFP